MRNPKAFDVSGKEIKPGSLVKIIRKPNVKHNWLRVGNTLRVSHWRDRTLGKSEYIIVFLESKKSGRLCSFGIRDKNLEII